MAGQPQRASPFENYSPSVRATIVGMHLMGHTPAEICNAIGCNIKTARLWINKFTVGSYEALRDHRKNNRRPQITTAAEDIRFVEHVDGNPHTTIASALAETDVPASVSTARRRLKQVGLVAHKPVKKAPLTEAHRLQRLQFARDHLNWTADQWATVIWSDEKVFNSADDGLRHVYRPRGTIFKLQPRYVRIKQWSGHITAGFWGSMAASGVMALTAIPPRMNAVAYVNILETVMLPCARERFDVDEYPVLQFMQDNSAVHTARVTQEWFEEHPDVEVLDWPSKSPDLNPIENLWSDMVREWVSGEDRTRDLLNAHVHRIWEDMEARPNLTQSLVQSMPKRMQCVIDNDGYWIPY